ncbi:MAG: hypothetical protein EKK61_01375 [Rickettsiales bacterium]|nr:MAG: hypothetical protein EKK61_01375 [Rickettsiales bacterium]
MKINLDEMSNAQSEPFKYAVFSGGGAKGAIYSGVHEELVNSGVLNEIEAIAGSSAGAITAAFIATGISVPNMKNTFLKTNLNNLQGNGIIQKDAMPLYELLHNTINNNITDYFIKNNNIVEKCKERTDVINNELNLLNEEAATKENIDKIKLLSEDRDKLEAFKNNPEKLFEIQNKAQNNGQITFGDLDMMRAIDPKIFKGLVITATNKTTGELTIFDAKKSPNVEIALACRASASLPLKFAPVEIDGQEYVDGGVRDNIPQKHFNSKDNTAQDLTDSIQDVTDSTQIINEAKQNRTLVLAFGSQEANSPAHIAVYSAQEKITNFSKVQKFLLNVMLKFTAKIGGEFVLTENKNKGFENLRENALNTIILDTKDVTTLDFKKAEKKSRIFT